MKDDKVNYYYTKNLALKNNEIQASKIIEDENLKKLVINMAILDINQRYRKEFEEKFKDKYLLICSTRRFQDSTLDKHQVVWLGKYWNIIRKEKKENVVLGKSEIKEER